MIFDDVANERFRQLLAQQLAFSQIKLVTVCIMGNHWHLLVSLDTAEPNPLQDAPDRVFLDHLGLIYSDTEVQKISWQLESFRDGGLEEAAAALRQKYLDRMRDIPTFVKELKQRFSRWHNRRMGRKGTVWEDRYKSVQVEDDDGHAHRRRLHRAQSGKSPARRGSQGLPLDRLWRSGGWRRSRPRGPDPLGQDRGG